MTKSIKDARREASALGFPFISSKRVVRRVPGEPRNETWYEVKLACPCGREKRLWIKSTSFAGFREELIEHLKLDGLWGEEHAIAENSG